MLSLKQLIDLKTDILSSARVKLVRHKDSRAEYREMLKNREGILAYQRAQERDVFRNCDYILSFIGQERRRSIFVGLFQMEGCTHRDGKYHYDLQELPLLDDFVDRLVIDWGASALAWHQWYHLQDKEVMEILPKGYLGTFPGLLDFALDFEELEKLILNPEANADWRHHLSAINGIYLILDKRTGQQYIGSAYGEQGLWGRWASYVATHTGGNRELIRLLEESPDAYRHFRFSVLQSLPSNLTPAEVIRTEALYKEKLGSRAHGLNRN